jgi:hypothetical protein
MPCASGYLDDPARTVTGVDVHRAVVLQRVKQLGFGMALSVGQHTNDKELSYYAQTPCGFEWEVGWNPIVVDESTLETHHILGNQHLGSHPEPRVYRRRCSKAVEVVPGLVELEVAVPRSRPAVW